MLGADISLESKAISSFQMKAQFVLSLQMTLSVAMLICWRVGSSAEGFWSGWIAGLRPTVGDCEAKCRVLPFGLNNPMQ